MASRPPTPPSKDPWEDDDFRFKTNGTPCEWGEAYHPGGYHPVHLGDVIQERYRIIRKVGWGQFSTVWLAVDMQMNRYVSLKITLATQQNDTSKEVSLYRSHLKDESPFLVALHDTIKITGPNGEHDGLVFETMGPNLTTLLKIRPEFQIGEPWERSFTKSFAKDALRDTIQALHFLHEHGVIHGDLHPGNILTCVEQLKATPDTEINLKQSDSDAQPLIRKDGKKDLWAPSYLLEPRPLSDYFTYDLHPLVKLSDLGGAFTEEDSMTGAKAITPVALRAPETIFDERVGKGIDVWAFGCLLFEMITGQPLFVGIQSLEGEDYDETSNDEHLIQLCEVIGPLPEPLLEKWRRADQYFDSSGNRLEVKPQEDGYVSGGEDMESVDGTDEEDEEGNGPPLAYVGRFLSLEDQFMAERPGDIGEAEAKEILELLRWIFQYDPAHRPSTSDLINHPWLRLTT
ncbi:SKY1-Protein serine kinase [Fusarium fujikuroi]|nr:SKY1-Protein serine kinase [Fusarium fujikuroi]SCO16516.1 SKY1-Protein serine kinase [Fusarium fujikuroi]SCO20578.1 SKY1-Protein serine kinase [Fusarium fujikuroi]SCO25650.1 SKY1-Protein serine kinase [Fusarium fujikuroi]SCO51416.1 SKY1-Protein serine kinase [Fusarium fujikuroi]